MLRYNHLALLSSVLVFLLMMIFSFPILSQATITEHTIFVPYFTKPTSAAPRQLLLPIKSALQISADPTPTLVQELVLPVESIVEIPEEPMLEIPEEPMLEIPEEPVLETPEEPMLEIPKEPVLEIPSTPTPFHLN